MQVVLIEGDGIGPEVTAAACRVIAAAGVKIEWVRAEAGLGAAERYGEPLPEATLELVRKHRIALERPLHHARRQRVSLDQRSSTARSGSLRQRPPRQEVARHQDPFREGRSCRRS